MQEEEEEEEVVVWDQIMELFCNGYCVVFMQQYIGNRLIRFLFVCLF